MKLLCDAVSFGFGPVGKLLTIIANSPEDWQFTILSQNSSLELAKYSRRSKIIQCDTDDENELRNHLSIFREADIFINIMNPISSRVAAETGTPTMQIDSLFWMWDDLPKYALEANYYFIQNFPGVALQVERLKPAHPYIIGPIVDTRFKKSKRKNQLLINLGGMQSQLITPGINSFYPHIVGDLLSELLHDVEFEEILITGSKLGLSSSNNYWDLPNASIKTMDHESFLSELSQSSFLITSPGLTTSFEAFYYNVPTVFLPPQNFSQFHILKSFQQLGIAQYTVHWRDLYPDLDLELGITETEGVDGVIQCINRFNHDLDARTYAMQIYKNATNIHRENQVSRQQEFLVSLGEIGNQTIIDKLHTLA